MATTITMSASPERSQIGRPSMGGIGRGVPLPPPTPHAENHRIPDACHGPAGLSKHHEEVAVKACLVPKELYEHIVEAGVTKSKWRLDKQVVMGLLAGFYIGFSFTFMMIIGGNIPEVQHGPNPGFYNLVLGAFGFPLGLFMICVVGADLFTSNCAYMMTALHEGKVSLYALLKSWILSWWVNLAGSIIMAEIVHAADVYNGNTTYIFYLANKKTNYTFSQCMCRAILANWLVNLAVWIANAAQDVTGKAVGIFLPISAFISIGGEHCIANQFLFSLAKVYGWEASVGTIVGRNLVPATLGNIIGGAFFVGTLYSLSLGTLFDSTYEHIGRAYAFAIGKTPEEVMPYGVQGSWWFRFMNWLVSPHWLHRDEENPDGTRARRHPSGGKALSLKAHQHPHHATPVIVVHDDSLVVDKNGNPLVVSSAAANGNGNGIGIGVAHNHITSTAHHIVPAGLAAGHKLATAASEDARTSSEVALTTATLTPHQAAPGSGSSSSAGKK